MKIKRNSILGLIVCIACIQLHAQITTNMNWNTKKCAVALTYDDALDVHLDNVVPALDSAGMKATFYIHGESASIAKRLDDWRRIALTGHELGNHTLFHPCSKTPKGTDWVKPEYNLDTYTTDRMITEIRICNTLLQAIDGKTKRTFAYTCGDMKVEGEFFMDSLKGEFVAARGVNQGLNSINEFDRYNVDAYIVHQQSAEMLIEEVKHAQEEQKLLVLLFHGVGGGHHLDVSNEAHSKLIAYLKENEEDIWVAPLVEIAEYIKTE